MIEWYISIILAFVSGFATCSVLLAKSWLNNAVNKKIISNAQKENVDFQSTISSLKTKVDSLESKIFLQKGIGLNPNTYLVEKNGHKYCTSCFLKFDLHVVKSHPTEYKHLCNNCGSLYPGDWPQVRSLG
jgi:hypothetical protein